MRSLRIATWTSGDPVSLSLVPYSVMSACLRSAVIDIDSVPSAIDDPYRSKAAVFDPGQRDQRLVVPSTDHRTLVEPVEIGPFAGIARSYPLPATQSSSFGFRQGHRRDVVQRGLDRKQTPGVSRDMPPFGYEIQWDGLVFGE